MSLDQPYLDWPAYMQAQAVMQDVWAGACSIKEALDGIGVRDMGKATGFVYFASIGRPRPDYVKVGFTSGNPYARLAALQTGCPLKIEMFGYIVGNITLEKCIQTALGHHHVHGEWFKFSDPVFIDLIKLFAAEVI